MYDLDLKFVTQPENIALVWKYGEQWGIDTALHSFNNQCSIRKLFDCPFFIL